MGVVMEGSRSDDNVVDVEKVVCSFVNGNVFFLIYRIFILWRGFGLWACKGCRLFSFCVCHQSQGHRYPTRAFLD